MWPGVEGSRTIRVILEEHQSLASYIDIDDQMAKTHQSNLDVRIEIEETMSVLRSSYTCCAPTYILSVTETIQLLPSVDTLMVLSVTNFAPWWLSFVVLEMRVECLVQVIRGRSGWTQVSSS